MKKRLITLLTPLLLLLAFIPHTAQAQTLKPASQDCTLGCQAYGYWNGTSYGLYDSYPVSNPNVTNCGSSCTYDRFDILNTGINGVTSSIVVGLDKSQNAVGYCHSTSQSLYYVVDAFGSGGMGDQLYTSCTKVPSGDVNQRINIQVGHYSSDGGGMLISIFAPSGTYRNYIPFSYGVIASGTRITRSETVFGNPISGHWEWGADWKYAQYVNSGGSFNYQQRGFDELNEGGLPTIFYWHLVPASGNSGGVLFTCIYDSGNTCTIGG